MENKTSKYFKYAFGEIILVVIGILIALQINNWNENTKEKIALNGYLKNISKNLKSDIKKLTELKTFRDSTKLGASLFMKIADQEKINATDLGIYLDKYLFSYNAFFDVYFKADKSGFESLKNSGYLGKLQGTSLESQLFDYYNLIETIEDEEKSYNNFIEEMEYETFKKDVIFTFIKRLRIFSKNPNPKTLNEIHMLMNKPSFKGANFRTRTSENFIEKYIDAKNIASNIIEIIEND
ncbi:DUF6090 family protein [Polaribacter porphyrae]|uniref:Uncharacterized protein n=1 Tax=Polaribacter porphyrae TaxID=1137780 RepID=A0A2S7WMF9_9FLAO|nr:DUF6090 family protein [Polaribacter porphyrae]PQJ78646.1 hypothetical protein BTO18_05340 [Polaribacter porphyrae]